MTGPLGCLLLVAENAPNGGVQGRNTEQNGDDGAHLILKPNGAGVAGANLSPRFGQSAMKRTTNLSLLCDLTTPIQPWRFQGAHTENRNTCQWFQQSPIGYFGGPAGGFAGAGETGAGNARLAPCGWADGLIQQA